MSLQKGVNLESGKTLAAIAGVSTNISAILINAIKGPVGEATPAGSLAEYERIFGIKSPAGTTSYESAKEFFTNAGAAPLNVVRVASSTVASSSKMIQDRNGTPADTLKIEGKTPGAWADVIQIEIKNDNFLTTAPASEISSGAESAVLNSITNLQVGSLVEFDNSTNQEIKMLTGVDAATKTISWTGGLTNTYPTTSSVKSQEFQLDVYDGTELVESWENLSMVNDVSHFCQTVVNDSVKGSAYIKVIDQKSTDTDEKDLPAVTAKTSLTGGADGLDDVVGADYEGVQSQKDGVFALDSVDGLARMCCPNPKLTDVDPAAAYKTLCQALISYVENLQTCSVILDIPASNNPTQAAAFVSDLESKKASAWYPWLKSGDVYIPPSSAVMGAAVRKDAQLGIHYSIGNKPIRGISGLEYDLSNVEDETLNNARVDTVRSFVGKGFVTWGGRTLSAESAWKFIDAAEYWNYVAASLISGTGELVFMPISPDTMGLAKRIISAFFIGEQQRGAVSEYSVICDSSNNTAADAENGILRIHVEYKKFGTAEKIAIVLTGRTDIGFEVE
jgi:phage tail sheath protein FI